MIDFMLKNPMRSIKNNDDVALITLTKRITYAQLHDEFNRISKLLDDAGINEHHRVLLIQTEMNNFNAYIHFLACMWHGCSVAYVRPASKKDPELAIKRREYDPTALFLIKDSTISIVKDIESKTKEYSTEAFCNFTHGQSEEHPLNCNPLHWNSEHYARRGHSLEAILKVAEDQVNGPINQLTRLDLSVPYSTDILIRSIFTGGTLVVVEQDENDNSREISPLYFTKTNINYVCGFRKVFYDIINGFNSIKSSNLTNDAKETILAGNIDACEYGGGILDDEMFESIFKVLAPKTLRYHFSSFFYGYMFEKYLTGNEDPNSLNEWNIETGLFTDDKEIDFNEDGEVLIKMKPDWEFEKLGDKFNIKDNIATYAGRIKEDFIPIQSMGGKIYLYEIESSIKLIDGVEGVMVFHTKNEQYLAKDLKPYGMVYFGHKDVELVKQELTQFLKPKSIPNEIFKIEKELFNKITNRSSIANMLVDKVL
jgi:hypothetical protein